MSDGLSAEERAAVKDRAKELRAESRRGSKADKVAAEAKDMREKIAGLSKPDRELAERVHAIVTEHAPALAPKLYYGMPGWAKDGRVLCFLQPAEKFKTRYATFGFNDNATLDDGTMWPTAFAVTTLSAADEKTIADLVRRAAV